MDKRTLSFFLVGLVAGFLLAAGLFAWLARSEGRSQPGHRVLKLAHVLPPTAPVHLGMEFMARRVAELSGGQIEIQIFPNGQLGSEPETIEQLQRGALAMAKASSGAAEGFIPEMAVFALPYLFPEEDHFWRVAQGPVGRELLVAGVGVGIRGLCFYEAGARSFYTVGEPVLRPEDLQGKKIRVMNSRLQMDMIEMLGGSPTPIPMGELYTALQQRMVDGAENNTPTMHDTRHWEVARNLSLDEHARMPDLLLCSEAVWQTLTPQQQAWMRQAAEESVTLQRELWKAYVEQCLANLEKEGVGVYRPAQEPFREAVKPMFATIRGTPLEILVNRIREEE